MKINSFITFIIFASLINVFNNSPITSKDNCIDVSDSFDTENIVYRSNSSTSSSPIIKKLQEILLSTDKLKAFAYDKPTFILVSEDFVKILKLDDNAQIIDEFETKELNHYGITAIALFDKKNIIAIGTQENDLFFFDISKKRFKLVDSYFGDGKLATSMLFSPDGSTLAVLNYESDEVALFTYNDFMLTHKDIISTEANSGPLIAKFSEAGDRFAVFCEKSGVIKICSLVNKKWILTNTVNGAQNQFKELLKDNHSKIDEDQSNISQKDAIPNNEIASNSDQTSNVDQNITSPDSSSKTNIMLTTKNKILTKTSRPLIKGKTLPLQKVFIYINDRFLDEIISDKSGNFSFRVKKALPNGSYNFHAKIKLNSNNEEEISNSIYFQINKHYPLKTGLRVESDNE